jgi:hypothetical protein
VAIKAHGILACSKPAKTQGSTPSAKNLSPRPTRHTSRPDRVGNHSPVEKFEGHDTWNIRDMHDDLSVLRGAPVEVHSLL